MRPDTNTALLRCPQCGSPLDGEDLPCPACVRVFNLAEAKRIEAARTRESEIAGAEFRPQFSLLAILAVTTVVGLLAAVTRVLPDLSVLLWLVLTPVVLRTAVVLMRRKAGGGRDSLAAMLAAFAGSCGLALVVPLALGGAFAVTCLTGTLIFMTSASFEGPLVVGITLGGISQIAFWTFFGGWVANLEPRWQRLLWNDLTMLFAIVGGELLLAALALTSFGFFPDAVGLGWGWAASVTALIMAARSERRDFIRDWSVATAWGTLVGVVFLFVFVLAWELRQPFVLACNAGVMLIVTLMVGARLSRGRTLLVKESE